MSTHSNQILGLKLNKMVLSLVLAYHTQHTLCLQNKPIQDSKMEEIRMHLCVLTG